MVKQTKTSQLNTRVTPEFKEKLKQVLKDENKTISDILENYVNTYYSTTPTGLIYQNKELEKELKGVEDEINKLFEKKNKILKKIKKNNDIINNSNFYDIEYYKDNSNVQAAINALKRYYNRKRDSISNIENIPNAIFRDVAETNNIKETDLKKIAATDFKNW